VCVNIEPPSINIHDDVSINQASCHCLLSPLSSTKCCLKFQPQSYWKDLISTFSFAKKSDFFFFKKHIFTIWVNGIQNHTRINIWSKPSALAFWHLLAVMCNHTTISETRLTTNAINVYHLFLFFRLKIENWGKFPMKISPQELWKFLRCNKWHQEILQLW